MNYKKLLDLNVKIASWLQPDANIIILTDKIFGENLEDNSSVKVIRMDVKGEEPMFERVVAMNAYVRSSLFSHLLFFLKYRRFYASSIE